MGYLIEIGIRFRETSNGAGDDPPFMPDWIWSLVAIGLAVVIFLR